MQSLKKAQSNKVCLDFNQHAPRQHHTRDRCSERERSS